MSKGAKLISSAIIGYDCVTCVINGRCYVITPPTIAKIAGAGHYLSNIQNGETVRDLLLSIKDLDNVAYALSWFIVGNDTLAEELKQANVSELIDALEQAFSLISVENFLKLSVLTRSVLNLIAKQK